MDKNKLKRKQREKRHDRIRMKISGTASVPRLNVYRSLKHIYAQIIDDTTGNTLVSSSSLQDAELLDKVQLAKSDDKTVKGKTLAAKKAGKILAEKAAGKKIKKIVFDKGPYKFHGRVKAFADGAREGGLEF
ncbi:50S ribosomal protein L18 [candidate division WOR-3 bacterium]|nr:50S ribosomal protein L18 [candidate division WOR-3 bacterium]